MTTPTWNEFAELALKRVRASGAEYGDIRIQHSTTQTVSGEDQRVASVRDGEDAGFGVRVLYHGGWGFAASSILSLEEVPRVADLAVEIAKGSASVAIEKVRLAEEPVHQDRIVTPCRIDPFTVPLEKKADLVLRTMEALHRQAGIVRSSAELWARRDRKLFVSTEGTRLEFDLLAGQGECTATALSEGRFASRSFNTPHLRRGYELIEEADFLREAGRVAAEAVEKVRAPLVIPGSYDLVLDPEHLSLTMHESCGHPSELDRALGYEANYAGTSFLTPDKLGTFRYGSPHVTLVADNTEPETLAATGYDDDGVKTTEFAIIKSGLFVDYQTTRDQAHLIGQKASHGCSYADNWASIPFQRMPNVSLEPGPRDLSEQDIIGATDDGIYIKGDSSYSIDHQRYNFQ